jgi:hypothetical protein
MSTFAVGLQYRGREENWGFQIFEGSFNIV